MNFHNITYPDMNNGDGLRVVLWLSGCSHRCKGCQNPQTWDVNSGIPFDENAKEELFRELSKDYISGITFTGGDPLHENNLEEVAKLIFEIRKTLPNKNIWIYTGYQIEDLDYLKETNKYLNGECDFETAINKEYENLIRLKILSECDVLVDGKYKEELRDVSLHWCGSSNQRVIDIQESLEKGEIVLWSS